MTKYTDGSFMIGPGFNITGLGSVQDLNMDTSWNLGSTTVTNKTNEVASLSNRSEG